jgi:hypothetical protein
MGIFSRRKLQQVRTQPPSAVQAPQSAAPQPRADDADAVYQNGRVVARAVDPQVDTEAKEIHFAELRNSDELLLPDECEFQKYTIMVQRIAHATKVDKGALDRGRVLRGVVAEILGYREQ